MKAAIRMKKRWRLPQIAKLGSLLAAVSLIAPAQQTNFASPATVHALSAVPYSVVTYDLRGNGILDLIVGSAQGSSQGVSVFLGNGDGTFEAPVSYATSAQCYSVAVADFNGDGYPDLVITDSSIDPGQVSILLGNGDGSFQNPVSYAVGSGPRSVAVGSLRGNGTLDLVVTDLNDTSEHRIRKRIAGKRERHFSGGRDLPRRAGALRDRS